MDRSILKPFEAHGVEFTGERSGQMYGYCPFSGKEDKFYVNLKNGLWDSKTAGLSGNLSKFLELRAKDYQQDLSGAKLKQLAENRQLRRSAMDGWGFGWDGSTFTFPIRDFNGHVQDIRRYDLVNKRILSTRGAKVGLFGAHRLKDNLKDPVYLCEGEWDAIALNWLLGYLHQPGVVLAVPGANTFKPEWVPWLNGRIVHSLYDADEAGRKGEEMIDERLKTSVRRLTFVHWPDEVPNGFDTRDWIVYGTTLNNTPEECWEKLQRRFKPRPKWEIKKKDPVSGGIKITIKKRKQVDRWAKTPPTLDDLHATFGKWLFLRSTEVIDVMLATALTQRLDGSPVWMFIVGPSGSAKTALVTSLSTIDSVYTTSTLTAPSLISGANFTGTDPSLIPRLDGHTLVVKDFTSILSLPDREQKEIFGVLRDAYDGSCAKIFGNGVERKYVSRFTVLAATTPRIYDLSEQYTSLGERFLKFLVGDNLHHQSENDIIRRAIENADRETAMKEELGAVTKAFLERTRAKVVNATLPDFWMEKIVSLAKFGARLRGSVSRDTYRNEIMTSRPMAEIGTRLGQQLAKLARGMAMVYGKPEVTEIEYKLVRKVMLDTISQRNEDVLRTMVMVMGGPKNLTPISMREMAVKTHYPFATIQRLMQDLIALQIVKRHGIGPTSTWTLSDYVRREVVDSGLYDEADLSDRITGKIRIIRPKKRQVSQVIRLKIGPKMATKVVAATAHPPAAPQTAENAAKSGAAND